MTLSSQRRESAANCWRLNGADSGSAAFGKIFVIARTRSTAAERLHAAGPRYNSRAMTWSEHWTITEPDPALPVEARAVAGRLSEALAARGLAIGPAIVHEGGELEGAQLECYGRYIEVSLGVGDLRGAFTIARAEG